MSCPACGLPAYRALYALDLQSYACAAGHAWTSRSKPGQTLSELLPPTKRPPNPDFWELAA